MASPSYPEPHNCFDTMQNFFSNFFSGRDNTNNNDSGNNNNGGNNNNTANGRNNTSTNESSSQPRQARTAAATSSRPSRPRQAAPADAAAASGASSSHQRTHPRPEAEGTQDGRHNLSPFEFLAEAFGHGLSPEQFFAAAQQAAQEAGLNTGPTQPGANQPNPNPPASCKAIRQLPTVTVTPEDLVDENNRECCICFESLNIGDRATRLPCAHIYHPRCIIQWLGSHSNTCPVCRYELPTEDDGFERGREERMKRRKPRYAPYELYRMNIRDLKELCRKIALDPGNYTEKKEMVRAILDSGKVEVIAAPEPVEYPSIGVLRSMGIRQLKNAMADAGVFFDPKDVVEKEDMVQIFVSSGRIILVEEEEGAINEDGSNSDKDDDGDKKMSGNTNYNYGHAPRSESDIKRARLSSNDLDAYSTSSMKDNDNVDEEKVEGGVSSSAAALNAGQGEGEGEWSIMSTTGSESDPLLQEVGESESSMNGNGQQQQQEQQREPLTPTPATGNISSPAVATTSATTGDETATAPTIASIAHNESHAASSSVLEASTGITARSVKELRRLAQELDVDISGCLEKREMIDLITANLGTNR